MTTRKTSTGWLADMPDDPRHGTENGYKNLGCRCDRCTEAHAHYYRGDRPGAVNQYKSRIASSLLKDRYHIAREAGYSPDEARKRQFWSDPLKEES